jgi:ribosomal protein S18 acetylase RimI-like enzyme
LRNNGTKTSAKARAGAGAVPPCDRGETNLEVHATQRGRGVGTALIESAEEKIRSRGFSRIGVGVADDNPKAARLYARLGYADTGLRAESRYMYPDDAGVPQEIVERNILLIKDLARHRAASRRRVTAWTWRHAIVSS